MPEFEVLKFCQKTENPCSGCHSCHSTPKKYSVLVKEYSKDIQRSVDAEIEELISKGYTRNEAVLKITKEEE